MHKVIYCECGWAGTPEQLERDEDVNNHSVKVCPRCGTDILPPAVNVDEKTLRQIINQQRQEIADFPDSREEEDEE